MKRKARPIGSGGRLRLTLLLAAGAAFLLVPPVSANAANKPASVEIVGSGSGRVFGEGPLNGNPPINCHKPSQGGDVCETEMNKFEALVGQLFVEEAAPGSEFVKWEAIEGEPVGCEEVTNPECGMLSFGTPVKVKAEFKLEPPKFKLTVTKNGSGSGTVTSSPAGINCGSECSHEYPEGTLVKLTGTPSTGSKPVVWESCPGTVNGENKCEVTMSAAKEAKATFNLMPESFSVTVEGEGKVECEDNGGGLGPCASSYLYGHTIKVVATAAKENKLAEFSGTGSAKGCSASPCTFEIKEASSVKVLFKSEKIRAEATSNVEGEVPQTTSLESTCGTVKLGEFKPGVTADYNKTCGVTLTSTGEETTLTAKDGSATHTGHLVQGSYFLPSALKTKATDSEGKGTGGGLTSLESPVTLLTFKVPVSKDATTLEFSQHIGEHDGLHTGVYSKLITLTLEQTKP